MGRQAPACAPRNGLVAHLEKRLDFAAISLNTHDGASYFQSSFLWKLPSRNLASSPPHKLRKPVPCAKPPATQQRAPPHKKGGPPPPKR